MNAEAMSTHNEEIIDVEIFRRQAQKDLSESNKYLSGWLEGWVEKNKLPSDSKRPWMPEGRKFIDYYETLYYVLNWFQQFKAYSFRELGWRIDKKVVGNIKDKLAKLINFALSVKDKNQFHEYFKNYDLDPLSFYTAVDYKFQNISGAEINNILDFGSGFGRQSFQWCSQENTNFFSIDAIESLYMLQNKVYSLFFPDRLREYFYSPERFRETDFHSLSNKLFHLPTWKMELLPERYFDLIICVQVLHELNEETLRWLLCHFKRIIKKNGFLYIRDNEFWMPTHKIRIGRELLKQGWELIFKYSGRENEDIVGVPRLWVFTDTDNSKCFRHKTRIKRIFLPSHPFSYNSWKDYGLPI